MGTPVRVVVALAALLAPAQAFARHFTVVSTPAANALTVVDLEDNSVVATVPLGGLPTGCAVLQDTLFVALSQSNALVVIDLKKGTQRTVPVGTTPVGVAAESTRRVYVANAGADTVSVVDPERASLLATIPVGDGPLALAAHGHDLYVANSGDATVSAVDTRSGSVRTIAVGAFPSGLALEHAKRRLYVANFLDDTVSVVDTRRLSVVATWPVARGPRALALDDGGKRLFVAGFEDGRLQEIDTRSGAVLRDVASGGRNPLDLLLGPHKQIYVAHLMEEEGIVALDERTLEVVATVGAPAGPLAFAGVLSKKPRLPSVGPLASAAQTLASALEAVARAAAAPALVAPQADAEDVEIFDGTFNDADWAVSGQGTHTSAQVPTDGNPGPWRRTVHAGPATSVHRLVRPGTRYDPAALGAIRSIDVSWHRRLFAENLALEGFLVEQNEVVYRTTEVALFLPTWQSNSRTAQTSEDFDDGSGNHPDFSAAGAPIRFGYFRRTTVGTTLAHGIDNFRVTVHPIGSNVAGVLRFVETFLFVHENDSPFVTVERRGGTFGAVSAEVRIQRPNGSQFVQMVSWPDGDNTPRPLLVVGLDLPLDSGALMARLEIQNPMGGVGLHSTRSRMAIAVLPLNWGPALDALFLQFILLFGGFSPGWLLALAAPAVVAALRRARGKRATSHPS